MATASQLLSILCISSHIFFISYIIYLMTSPLWQCTVDPSIGTRARENEGGGRDTRRANENEDGAREQRAASRHFGYWLTTKAHCQIIPPVVARG